MYDVAIIGAGPAGLSCALTLASSKGVHGMPQDKKMLVFDNGKSHLMRAELHNVPGFVAGTPGEGALLKMREQIAAFENSTFCDEEVVKISGSKGEFIIETEAGNRFEAQTLVLACGMEKQEFFGLPVKVIENDRVPKPNFIRIECDELQYAAPGILVAGLLAGEPTMYACASGSGVRAATQILSEWVGRLAIIHDVPGSRK